MDLKHYFWWVVALVLVLWMIIASAKAEECGIASVYNGGRTASGQISHGSGTAAHKHLRFGTMVTVKHGTRSVQVRINDRGPFVRGRIIDLLPRDARDIGISGLGHVCINNS